jgi:hypothetical protein
MKKIVLPFCCLSLVLVALLLFSCRKDKGAVDTTFSDIKFFQTIGSDTIGDGYYSDATANSVFTADAFHGSRIYKLRLNAKGMAALTAGGKLPNGGSFPDSTLLVKELHSGTISSPIDEYSALYKLNGAWNWARFGASGSIIFSINGDANTNCVSCHSFMARDYVRTFDAHP